MAKTIVITGASSGIGFHLATSLAKENTVIGISRKKPQDMSFEYIECDLTKPEDVTKAVASLQGRAIDVLVHCAGVGTGGALEAIGEKDTAWVLDVNLFGVINLTNGLFDNLRLSTQPKIIVIGSVAGEITIPYQVSYSMSKSAVQRYAEGLRLELKGDIDVSAVLPGDTKTGFTNNRKKVIKEGSRYKEQVTRSIEKMAKDEQNGVSPMKVVKVIEKLIKKKRMPRSIIVGLDYKLLVFLSHLLPKRIVEFLVSKLYG